MSLFVAGTDTGVGKTVVSTILALKFGYRYWKPIQSGLDVPTDSEWVAERIGWDFVQAEVYRCQKSISPHASARLEGVDIKMETIISQIPSENTIIEGCGGLLVPLNSSEFIIDMAEKMGCAVLLVAKSGLGTINHTLLSLEALRKRDLPILGVVLNGEVNPSNRDAIEQFGNIPVICQIPILTNLCRLNLSEIGQLIQMEITWK